MTHGVICASPSDSLERAYDLMRQNNFKGMPILEKGKLIGIITLSDIWRVPVNVRSTKLVSHVMSRRLITTSPEETLTDAWRKMATNEIGRLPVISKDGKLTGIITRLDHLREYQKWLRDVTRSATNSHEQVIG